MATCETDESFELTLPAVPASVPALRHRVDGRLERWGIDAALRADIALAVSEALSNAIIHAFAGGEPGLVTVEAEQAGDGRLRVIVRDDGNGLGPRSDSPGLGLGLPLIARLAETIDLAPGPGGRGTALAMIFAPQA